MRHMNTKKFVFILFAGLSISFAAKAQVYDANGATLSQGARDNFTKNYSNAKNCWYADQDGNARSPKIVQIPKVDCGTLGSSKTPQGLCDDYVRCQGPAGQIDAVFHVRCYSYDGKSCGDAMACRDAAGINVYEQISSGISGFNMIDQKSKSGTSK